MVVAVHDTICEVTTITVQQNAAGDTVFRSVVTDRIRARDRDQSQLRDEHLEVRGNMVCVERKDSVEVQKSQGARVQDDKPPAFISALKWIFLIIVGLVALIITVKVCLRK